MYELLAQGWDGRPARYTRLEEMAAYYLRDIRRVQPNGPYFLGGFCVGAILAFEIAQQLRNQGHEIGLLLMVDPNYGKRDHRQSLKEGPRRRFLRHLGCLASLESKARAAYLYEKFLSLTRRSIKEQTERAKSIAAKVYLGMKINYPIPLFLRAQYANTLHSRAKRAYQRHVYPGRMVVFQSEDRSFDPISAWEGLAAGGLEIHDVPGGHRDVVFDEAKARGLARELKRCLDRAQLHAPHDWREQPRETEEGTGSRRDTSAYLTRFL